MVNDDYVSLVILVRVYNELNCGMDNIVEIERTIGEK